MKSPRLFTITALSVVLLPLASCGKKKDPPAEPETSGPQSTEGGILDSVQKTADKANERTRSVKEATDAVSE